MKRAEFREKSADQWDVIVIGGGMTGAGVFRETARAGYRVLLLEQRDFAWGTSSRSGKLVHGGLRYLAQGQIKTTWHSVREREKLLRMYPGLVENVTFVVPVYDRFAGMLLRAGLSIYDAMAFRRTHQYHEVDRFSTLVPDIDRVGLRGGFVFRDARTDDARLVYRVIREGEKYGGTAMNYVRVEEVVRDERDRVIGLTAVDEEGGQTMELRTRVVVNATGAWADDLRGQMGEKPKLRKLRGSHLIFPGKRLPLDQAVSFTHPDDHRPLYAMPWQGVTLVGTTDLDHEFSLANEPRISREEGEYLLEGLKHCFPAARLTAGDVTATFAGVRPVLNTGKVDPSKEARDYAVWSQKGLVTVTGGKLTTFALLARGAMREIAKWAGSPAGGTGLDGEKVSLQREYDPDNRKAPERSGPREPAGHGRRTPAGERHSDGERQANGERHTDGERQANGERQADRVRLAESAEENRARFLLTGRYGSDAPEVFLRARNEGWGHVPGTDLFWAEALFSAGCEQVVHLEDFMLRRTRLGLLLPVGGRHILSQLRERLAPALGWDGRRWEEEEANYLALWDEAYNPDFLLS
ncbi:aerobic glycerol-3-phosphate dehydrogenase [Peptococcaceae bacterium CEB3]|nr:aerobic glycerol-3-phosphate dehydrogenase [Peptococcaceae bacterium CEB3]